MFPGDPPCTHLITGPPPKIPRTTEAQAGDHEEQNPEPGKLLFCAWTDTRFRHRLVINNRYSTLWQIHEGSGC